MIGEVVVEHILHDSDRTRLSNWLRASADPAFFVTELDGWKVGDTFLAGPEPRPFRIVAIDEEVPGVRDGYAAAVWIVEPV